MRVRVPSGVHTVGIWLDEGLVLKTGRSYGLGGSSPSLTAIRKVNWAGVPEPFAKRVGAP